MLRLPYHRPFSVCLVIFTSVLMLHFYAAHIINYTSTIDRGTSPGINSYFSIKTDGCVIPDFDPFDDRVNIFLYNYSFVCPSIEGNGLTYIENHTLKVNTTVLETFNIQLTKSSAENFTCCMKIMYRHEVEHEDNFMRYFANLHYYSNSFIINGHSPEIWSGG